MSLRTLVEGEAISPQVCSLLRRLKDSSQGHSKGFYRTNIHNAIALAKYPVRKTLDKIDQMFYNKIISAHQLLKNCKK